MVKGQQASAMGLIADFTGDPEKVRYVELPTRRPGAPLVTAAIGRDEAFGDTVLVVSY